MPTPTPTALADYTGTTVNATQATAVIGVVKAMVSAHTRGVGFTDGEPNDELSSVILSVRARLLMNTTGTVRERWADFRSNSAQPVSVSPYQRSAFSPATARQRSSTRLPGAPTVFKFPVGVRGLNLRHPDRAPRPPTGGMRA